jgi:ankyrin repeat protein
MQKLFELARENLKTEEIKNNLLLATDSYGQTALLVVAYYCNLDVMLKLLKLKKEILTT